MTTEIIQDVLLANGIYDCFWGGYVVWLAPWPLDSHTPSGIRNRFATNIGIRTPKASAIMTVKNHRGTVKVKED